MKSRLISKQDYDINHKELEKILPRSGWDLVVVLDDSAEVWKYHRENLIQVLPFFFWKNEDDPEKVCFTANKDYYLHYLWSFLDRAISLMRRFRVEHPELPPLKIQKVLCALNNHIFHGKRFHLTGVVPKSTDVSENPQARKIKRHGGSICEQLEGSNMLLVGGEKGGLDLWQPRRRPSKRARKAFRRST